MLKGYCPLACVDVPSSGLSAGDIWCGLIGGFAGKFKYLFSGSVFETLNRTVSLSEVHGCVKLLPSCHACS